MKTELALLMCLVTLTMGAVSKVQNVFDVVVTEENQPGITTMEPAGLVESAESTNSIDFNDMETAASVHHHSSHHHHHHVPYVPNIQPYIHRPTYSNIQNPTSYQRKYYYPRYYYPNKYY
jgi:hypothetical protein